MTASETKIRRTMVEKGLREKGGSDSNPKVIQQIVTRHEDEKREIQDLNEKFVSYLERVKFLDEQNIELRKSLDEIRSKWGFDSVKIKEQYGKDLNELRKQLDFTARDKNQMILRNKRAEYDTMSFDQLINFEIELDRAERKKLNDLQCLRDSTVAEINNLEVSYNEIQEEVNHYRDDLDRLLRSLENLKNEYDNETMQRVQLQNEIQTLEEQLGFTKALYEEELNDMQTFATIHIDSVQFYRSELAKAISAIKHDFEQLNQTQKSELEEYYRIKTEEITERLTAEIQKQVELRKNAPIRDISELRTELINSNDEYNRIKEENTDLEANLRELEEQLANLRYGRLQEEDDINRKAYHLSMEIAAQENAISEIIESNVNLRFEINTYRRLLETENMWKGRMNRNGGFSGNEISTGHHEGEEYQKPGVKGPAGAAITKRKMNIQKSSRGPMSINSIDPDGKFIVIENESKAKEQDISGWSIIRMIEGQSPLIYYLPISMTLSAGRKLKIYSRTASSEATDADSIVADLIKTWGTGNRIETKLIGDDGTEKAVFYERLV